MIQIEFDSLKFLDETEKFVEMITGLKHQFINAGWSELIAEGMALEMFSLAVKLQESKK